MVLLAATLSSQLTGQWSQPAALVPWLDYFHLPAQTVEASAAWLQDGDPPGDTPRLFSLKLVPPNPKGRVLVVHGYLAHAGHHPHLATELLNLGWEVWFVDLPGFGLSEGERNDIASFHDYGQAALRALHQMTSEAWSGELPPRFAAIGHSTGCAALAEALLRDPGLPLENVIFAAPLVRVTGWSSKVWASGFLGDSRWPYPRWPLVSKGTVGDADYLRFQLQEDPLFVPEFSPHWIAALAEWTTWFEAQTAPEGTPPVVIWQGDTDDLVDWRYNLPLLQRVFPRTNVQMFPGLSHTILNEAAERSVPVWRALGEELADYRVSSSPSR